MTGVKTPAAVLGASVVISRPKGAAAALSGHLTGGVLPFTGIALGVYLALGVGLVLTGLVLRACARARG